MTTRIKESKMMRKTLAVLVMCTLPAAAAAAPSTFRQSVAAKASSALHGKTLATFVRVAPEGSERVLNKLSARFEAKAGAVSTADAAGLANTDGRLGLRGKGWVLEVENQGETFRYRNTAELEGGARGPELNARMKDTEATARAASFVNSNLSDLVTLASGETLEPWYVSYGISTAGRAAADAGEPEQRVQAIKVVFTRAIDGIPVVGNGSKVTVFMKHDGTPVGFEANWSRFERTSKKQTSVARGSAEARIASFAHARLGVGQETSNDKVECGYYDPGQLAAGGALQLACVHSYTISLPESGLVPKTAWIDAVPVGAEVTADARWPESGLVR